MRGAKSEAWKAKHSEAMKRVWADPARNGRLREAFEGVRAEGRWARSKPEANGHRKTENRMRMICVSLDDESFEGCKRIAARDNKSFAEIVRTFVQWGLDEEGIT